MASTTESDSAGARRPEVLATFAEEMVRGRRVAILGASTGTASERVAEMAGRRVHVFDPDARRAGRTIAAGTHPNVKISPLESAGDAHHGAFDVVIVFDIGTLGSASDAVIEARAFAGPRGLVIVAAPNPESNSDAGTGYYELYDLVADRFEHVSMHGHAPFFGFTVASFSEVGEPAVTIDASLMDAAEEPTWFVAVASDAPIDTDPYLLVQVPGVAPAGGGPDNDAALAEAQLQRSTLSAELEKAKDRERAATQRAAAREATNKKLSARLSDVEDQLERVSTKSNAELRRARQNITKLERRLRQAESAEPDDDALNAALTAALAAQSEELADAHQAELDKMLDRIAELEDSAPPTENRAHEFQLAELKRSLAEARREASEHRREREAAEAERATLRRKLVDAEKERDALRAAQPTDDEDAEHASEVQKLEERLVERGRRVEQLERDVREAERVGRELVTRLSVGAVVNGEAGALRAQVAALTERCTRYEADLRAATWHEPVEPEVSAADASDVAKLEQALSAAHDELADLRRRLAES